MLGFKFNKKRSVLLGAALSLSISAPQPAAAQAEPLLGQLMLVGFNFCPRGWSAAEGQLLPISQYTALFSLFGTTYGGDGRTTFALPDLRGRAPISDGTGPGLAAHSFGEKGGSENLTLTVANMPAHKHGVQATNADADKPGPGDKYLAASFPDNFPKYQAGPPNKTMGSEMITETGGGQAINKRSPYLAMKWCVALTGVFPSRN